MLRHRLPVRHGAGLDGGRVHPLAHGAAPAVGRRGRRQCRRCSSSTVGPGADRARLQPQLGDAQLNLTLSLSLSLSLSPTLTVTPTLGLTVIPNPHPNPDQVTLNFGAKNEPATYWPSGDCDCDPETPCRQDVSGTCNPTTWCDALGLGLGLG